MRAIFLGILFTALVTVIAPSSAVIRGSLSIFSNGFGGGPNLRQQNAMGTNPLVVPPSQYYIPANSNGAISTADAWLTNGVYGVRPYDLTATACGSYGASFAASHGRYIWPVSPDHYSINTDWTDGDDIYAGFTNDPGVLPTSVKPIARALSTVASAPGASFTGTIAGTTLTATSVTGGIALTSPLIISGSTVAHIANANLGTGIGGAGSYTLDTSLTVGTPTAMTTTLPNVQINYFPYFACDPDDVVYPYKIYLQVSDTSSPIGAFQTGFIGSSDLINWVTFGSATRPYSGSTEIARAFSVYRSAVNTWKALGATSIPTVGNQFADSAIWTGTSGSLLSFTGTYSNTCLPSNSPPGSSPCPAASTEAHFDTLPDGLTTTVASQSYVLSRNFLNANGSGSNQAGEQISLVPVDANFNAQASPAIIPISNLYCAQGGNFIQAGGCFPGPQYLQSVGGYQEGGVLHVDAVSGFFACLQPACTSGQVTYGKGNSSSNGGLNQQLVDRYCYVVDASAAANAAPTGVTATASAGVVTITWDQCLAGVSYHLYYGFSPNDQSHLIGTITGASRTTTYTPFLQTPQTVYFRLVTLNSGVEQGSRIVSTYVSPSVSLVNQHVNRVLAAGGDPATVDRQWLDSVQSFLSSQTLTGNVRYWGDAGFGVTQDVSGNASVMFDIGSTLRPAFGDWGFCNGQNPCSGASTAIYNPTALGSTTPGIVNPSTNGFGFAGTTAGNRLNTLRRMVEITACSVYSKPGTALTTLLGYGGADFQPPMMTLQHTAGSPGNASFTLWDDVAGATVTSAMSSATGSHIICGTFSTAGSTSVNSKGTLIVYADGVAGTPDTTTLHTNVDPTGVNTLSLKTTLLGQLAQAGLTPFLGMGSTSSKTTVSATPGPGPLTAPNLVFEQNEGNFTEGATIVFDKALSQSQITALTNLYLNRITPPVAQAYNITSSPFNATCNGVADDSAAFSTFNTTAVAWDAANPSVPGVITLTSPNSTCMFLQAGSGVRPFQGIVNHKVRLLAAGASSKWSDGGTGGGWFLGALGQNNNGTSQSTTQTVSKGATSVALTACPGAGCAAELAKYTIGQWALMTGLAMQANGYPTNPAFWDYVLVSGKTATDIQFATTPLTHDYKSTWPLYGTAFYGGPATIYPLDSSWPLTLEVNGMTFDLSNSASSGESITGKDITLKNVTTAAGNATTCEVPSQNMSYRVINSTLTDCTVEVDKIIDFLMYQNISAMKDIDYQSASVKQTLVSRANVTTFLGTGINSTTYASAIASYQPGPHSFGGAYGTTTLMNSVVNGFAPSSSGSSTPGAVGSWSGGVYTIANSSIPGVSGGNDSLPWAFPGLNINWQGQGPTIQVLDISSSGGNTLVTTSLAGGFPTMPNGSTISATTHSAPMYFGSGNTGTALASVTLNPSAAYQGAPLGSYYTQTITASNGNPASALTPYAFGLMLETDWAITAACGSASNFEWVPTNFIQTFGSSTKGTWAPTANGLTASATPRQMFPTTTAGAQSGDALAAPGANTWLLFGQDQPSYHTVANCASASTTVTIQTNQGVVNAP